MSYMGYAQWDDLGSPVCFGGPSFFLGISISVWPGKNWVLYVLVDSYRPGGQPSPGMKLARQGNLLLTWHISIILLFLYLFFFPPPNRNPLCWTHARGQH